MVGLIVSLLSQELDAVAMARDSDFCGTEEELESATEGWYDCTGMISHLNYIWLFFMLISVDFRLSTCTRSKKG